MREPTKADEPTAYEAVPTMTTVSRVRLLVDAWLDANNLEATQPAIDALVAEIGKLASR